MNHKVFRDPELYWNESSYDSLGMDQEAAIFYFPGKK